MVEAGKAASNACSSSESLCVSVFNDTPQLLPPIRTQINAKETLEFPPSNSNLCPRQLRGGEVFYGGNAFAPQAMIGNLISRQGEVAPRSFGFPIPFMQGL